jgi:hypothetical protein
VVTLVLDYCFSATIYRRIDPSIRSLPYNAEINLKYPLDLEKSLRHRADLLINRDTSILIN